MMPSSSRRTDVIRRLLLVSLVGVLGACTEPAPAVVVSVTQHYSAQNYAYPQAYAGAIACDYSVTATATGARNGDYADWLGVREQWSLNGTFYMDTDSIPASDVAAEWGSSQIYPGQTQSTSRYAYWSGPFQLKRTYRYRSSNGHIDSSTFVLDCN